MDYRISHLIARVLRASTVLLLFALCADSAMAHGISDADKQAMLEGGYVRYIGLGASHMLTGYDHLLFLFGVMFFLTNFKEIVKFITAFTLGHCITLIGATFLNISANYFLVDAVIALTVFYKGFDNINGFKKYLGMEKAPNLLRLVFLFGLIHGFGLSTRLQQLPLGDDNLQLLGQILSFNLGVEVGQIVALALMLLFLNLWRRSATFEKFSAASNVGLMAAGVLLFLMQMHGFTHQVFVNEMPLNTAAHLEAHSRIEQVQRPSDSWSEPIEITIPAGKGLEYKLLLRKGAQMHYQWSAPKPLSYDFHGEATGAQGDDFTSFKKARSSKDSGSLTAPFAGTIGWWWKNNGMAPVTLTLRVKGSYELPKR